MTTDINIGTLDFSKAKILVVGDVMLDQYWHGSASRISPEAPVPVVKIEQTDNRVGAAANVANNLVALGCQVKLLGITGQDSAADILQQLLTKQNIAHEFVKLKEFSTITKLRILCRHQQMIRLDHEDDLENIYLENLQQLHDLYATDISNYEAIILSDYAKGVLTDPQPYIKSANVLGIPVFVDPKNKDFTVYRGAQMVKPNLSEFEEIVGKCKTLAVLEERAHNLIAASGIDSLVITRGANGMTLVTKDKPAVHMPAQSGEVYDVTGAGDTVIAMLTAGLAAGMELEQAVYLSTVAAGIVVGKVGTATVSVAELKQAIHKSRPLPLGVADEVTVRELVKLSQARGEKVVFVNGCYDLLHYGHIRFFEQARALGDRLIVGVNTDESIKRLKGESRPFYNLAERMEVLAGLKAVSWVVPFAENTPGRLVEALNPDVLVKGGENFKSIADIPEAEGAAYVLSQGGQVHLIARTEGCSSTEMLNFMNEEHI